MESIPGVPKILKIRPQEQKKTEKKQRRRRGGEGDINSDRKQKRQVFRENRQRDAEQERMHNL